MGGSEEGHLLLARKKDVSGSNFACFSTNVENEKEFENLMT